VREVGIAKYMNVLKLYGVSRQGLCGYLPVCFVHEEREPEDRQRRQRVRPWGLGRVVRIWSANKYIFVWTIFCIVSFSSELPNFAYENATPNQRPRPTEGAKPAVDEGGSTFTLIGDCTSASEVDSRTSQPQVGEASDQCKGLSAQEEILGLELITLNRMLVQHSV